MEQILSPDLLYKGLLLAFVGLSLLSIFIFWHASPRLKMVMVLLTFVELGIVIFISFLLFKEITFSPNHYDLEEREEKETPFSAHINEEDILSKSPILAKKNSISPPMEMTGTIKKLFLTAETFKREHQYEDALHFYEMCLKKIDKKTDSMRALLLYKMADMKRMLDDPKEALTLFYKTLELFKIQRDNYGVATVLNRVGRTQYQMSNFDLATKAHEQSLKIFSKLSKKAQCATAWHGLGNCALAQGKMESALGFFEKAENLFEESAHMRGRAHVLLKKSDVYIILGDYETSSNNLKTALKIFQELGDSAGEGRAYVGLGKLCYERSQYEKSRVYLEKATIIFDKIPEKRIRGICARNLADAALRRNKIPIALELVEKSIKLFTLMRDKRHLGKSLVIKSQILLFQDEIDAAYYLSNQAVKLLQEAGDKLSHARALSVKAQCLKTMGHLDEAREQFSAVYKYYKEQHLSKWEGTASLGLAQLYFQMDDYPESHFYFYNALKNFRKINDRYWEMKALLGLAQLETLQHNFQRAVSLLEEARSKARVTENTLVEGQVLRVLATIDYHMGDYTNASVSLETALNIFESLGYNRGLVQVLSKQSQLHIVMGNYETAEVICEKILTTMGRRCDFFVELETQLQLAYLLQRKGKTQESIEHYERILARTEEKKHPVIFSKTVRYLAEAYNILGQFKKAEEVLNKFKPFLKDEQNGALQAKHLITYGVLKMRQGDMTQSEACFEKSLHTFKQLRLKRWQGVAHYHIALTNYYLGDHEKVEYHLERATHIFNAIGARPNKVRVLFGIGILHFRRGKLSQGTATLNEALLLAQRIKDVVDEARISMAFADLKRYTETPEEVKLFFEKALQKCREIDDMIGIGYGLSGLGYLESIYGNKVEAKKLLLQSYSVFEKSYYVAGMIKTKKYLGDIYFHDKNFKEAQKAFDEVLEVMRKHNVIQNRGELFKRLGHLEYKKGNLEKALRLYEDALSSAKRGDNRRSEVRILRHLAKVHGKLLNEHTYPREALNRALRHFKENNDLIFEADTLVKIGDLERHFNNNSEALSFYRDALKLGSHIKNEKIQAKVLAKLGKFFIISRDYEESKKHLRACLKMAEKNQDMRRQGKALKRLGIIAHGEKSIKEASGYLKRALLIFKQSRDIKQINKTTDFIRSLGNHAKKT